MPARGSVSELIRKYFAAYEAKERAAVEPLLTEDFTFSSPLDDHIDRGAYFSRCWPNSARIRAFTIEKLFEQGNEAFVLYELHPTTGESFRNTEFFKLKGNKICEVQVFFGSGVGAVEGKRWEVRGEM
jgi:ketosteroid isomerase-like protein